ncbi:hypothetical protein [Moritella marina]
MTRDDGGYLTVSTIKLD